MGLGCVCWTAPVWLARDSVSLICINLHERCLIIFLPCIHVSGIGGLYFSHCLYGFWVGFLSVFIWPPASPIYCQIKKKKKELSIKVKNVGKAHRGAGTYNSSHKIIHILVSGRSQETLLWEYFPPLLLSLQAGNSTPGDSRTPETLGV